jgi:hypothetical protein
MGKWLERAALLEAQYSGDVRDVGDEMGAIGPIVSIVPASPPVPASDASLLKTWRSGLASLDPDGPLGGIGRERWGRLVRDAVVTFNGWAPQAAALGWGTLDLFGVDPKLRPEHQVLYGLAWRLECWRLVALSEGIACLEGRFGKSPGRYFRGDVSRLLPLWELP